MPAKNIWIKNDIYERLRDEPNASQLVNRLLAGHYASTNPGPYLPTVEKHEKFNRLKKNFGMREEPIKGMHEGNIVPMTQDDWGA